MQKIQCQVKTNCKKICVDPLCQYTNPYICSSCEENHQHNGQSLTVRLSKFIDVRENLQHSLETCQKIRKNYQGMLQSIQQFLKNIIIQYKTIQNVWINFLEEINQLVDGKLSSESVVKIWEKIKINNLPLDIERCNQMNFDLSENRKNTINKFISKINVEKIQQQQKEISRQQQTFLSAFANIFSLLPTIITSNQSSKLNIPLLKDAYQLKQKAYNYIQQILTGKLFEILYDYKSAIEIYDIVIKNNPSNAQILARRANLFKSLQKYELALDDYEQVLLLTQKNIDPNLIHYERGIVHSLLGNFSAAEKDFKKCMTQIDDKYGATLKLVQILKKQKRFVQAELYLKEYVSKITNNNDKLQAYLLLADIANSNQKSSQAIQYYSQVLKIDDKNFNALVNRAALYHQTKYHEESKQDYSAAIILKPSNPNLYYNRGVTYIILKQKLLAIADFKKVIDLDSEFKFAFISLANTYLELENKEEALYYYSKASKYFPDNYAIWYNMGLLYSQKAPINIDIALDCFNNCLLLKPSYVEAYLGRVKLFMQREQNLKQAETDLTKILELGNRNISTLYNRGVIRQKLGKEKEALDDYNEILLKDPNHIISLKSRARILFKIGNMEAYNQDITKINQLQSK